MTLHRGLYTKEDQKSPTSPTQKTRLGSWLSADKITAFMTNKQGSERAKPKADYFCFSPNYIRTCLTKLQLQDWLELDCGAALLTRVIVQLYRPDLPASPPSLIA